jgi:DNA-binding MarR family transcriptional regulator
MENQQEKTNTVYFLQQLGFVFERHCDQVFMEQLGIGYSQYKILNLLKEQSGARQNELATALHQTEASISRQVKILIKRGLIINRVNPKNKREKLSTVTYKGERITDAANDILDKYDQAVTNGLDEKQKTTLLILLQKIQGRIR